MSNDACWRALALLAPASCSLSSDFHTATIEVPSGGATGQVICAAPFTTPTYFEGAPNWTSGRQAFGVQPASFTGPSLADNYSTPGTAWVSGYGELYVNGSIALGAGTFATSAGGVLGFATDPVNQLLWVRSIVAGVAGPWNGNASADPVAGVGGISIAALTGPFVPFYSCNGSGSANTVVLNSGGSAFAAPAPAGYGNLSATPEIEVASMTGVVGEPASIAWVAGNMALVGGLDCTLDGGVTWTTCSGTTTGASGTAIGPVVSTAGATALSLRDTSNLLNQSTPFSFFAFADLPGGTGALIASLDAGGVAPFTTITGTIAEVEGFIFAVGMQATSTGHGVTGGMDFNVSGVDAANNAIGYQTNGTFTGTDTDGQAGFVGIAPLSGPAYVDIGDISSVTGTVILTPSGDNCRIDADISNNGTPVTYSYLETSVGPSALFNGFSLGCGTIYPFIDPEFGYSVRIWKIAGSSIAGGEDGSIINCCM